MIRTSISVFIVLCGCASMDDTMVDAGATADSGPLPDSARPPDTDSDSSRALDSSIDPDPDASTPPPDADLPDSSTVPDAPVPTRFSCTQVNGFSQTIQWYTADFETYVDDDAWQRQAIGGSSIDLWADPDFSGWDEPIRSSCAAGSDRPDRFVQTISGAFGEDVDEWERQIRAAVDTIRMKHPMVRQIVLQPVVGGPAGVDCPARGGTVRANRQQPFIVMAIERVVGGDVVAGPTPMITSCDHYRDATGHLTDEGSRLAARLIGEHYAALEGS